jgi:hypothetical protein
VVWVKWDTEFVDNKEGHANKMAFALKDDMYASEKAHCGWNLLTEEYVRWAAQGAQQQLQEQQEGTEVQARE